jgi:hypothetical protein
MRRDLDVARDLLQSASEDQRQMRIQHHSELDSWKQRYALFVIDWQTECK